MEKGIGRMEERCKENITNAIERLGFKFVLSVLCDFAADLAAHELAAGHTNRAVMILEMSDGCESAETIAAILEQ